MNKNLLLIFTRNPELGKCKTRLAATIGNEAALNIYKFLLQHTVSITKNLNVDKQVHYSVRIRDNDYWKEESFSKRQQKGHDLGTRMQYAFKQGFADGYKHIIIIGSDMYDMDATNIEEAFQSLQSHDFVVGPATDGGYYLLGMNTLCPTVFSDKEWGANTVLKKTLENLNGSSVKVLAEKNDIDYEEDLNGFPVFDQFLN